MAKSKETEPFVSASQVLYRLAEIEEAAGNFYKGLWEGTKSEWIRELAEVLIRAEQRHRKRFLEYAQQAEQSSHADANILTRPLPPQVLRLLSTPVTVSKSRMKKTAPYTRDEEALKIAIRAEESTAFLLAQLCEYVPRGQRRYINRVIKEEWHHKALLEDLYKKTFAEAPSGDPEEMRKPTVFPDLP